MHYIHYNTLLDSVKGHHIQTIFFLPIHVLKSKIGFFQLFLSISVTSFFVRLIQQITYKEKCEFMHDTNVFDLYTANYV